MLFASGSSRLTAGIYENGPPTTSEPHNLGLGRARKIILIVLERGDVGLSYDVSFIFVGAGNRKLLMVEVIISVIFGT